jgi:tetratricopeptide (TPR) repeat protein
MCQLRYSERESMSKLGGVNLSRTGWRLRNWAGVFLVFSSLLAFGQFEDSEAALRRADRAMGQGRFDVAQAIYDRLFRDNPNLTVSADRCRNIADANIRATRPNLKVGVDWLQKAADLLPNDDATRQRLADALLRNGEFARAANQYHFLLKKSPASQQYLLGLAVAQRDLGQYDEAASLLSSALKDHPEYNLLHNEYGRTLSYQRQFQAATEQYEQVLKTDPDNLAARLGMAKVLSWQGDQEHALVEYDKVLQRDPGNYDALVGEAFSLIWTGRQNEAIPLLERANSRHPEDNEVRDALKRLGGVTVFTGEIRAGDTPLPILPPAGKKPSSKTTTSSSSPEAKATKPPESTPPEVVKPEEPTPAPSSGITFGERRTIWWVLGMGAMMMVAVFAIAGFLLWVLPAMRAKREAKSQVISNPLADHKPVEPWVRLEEFTRNPREDSEKSAPIAKPVDSPKPFVPEPEPIHFAAPAETLKAALDRSNGSEPAAEPTNGDEPPARGPRRRRGVAERPWWRDLPTPDQVTSASLAIPTLEEMAGTPPIVPASTAQNAIDAYESDTVVLPAGAANPLTPAAERPSRPEEPPPTRPFTLVLSRALERAGDGQVEEAPIEEASAPPAPTEDEIATESAYAQGDETQGAEPELEISPADDATLQALQGSTAVIVGCGVMVSHYRSLLRAAGIDVRLFTFWDLAMTSMRKRRADILIIDGDALDGFTSAQMYTSAHVERYMFGVVLVGVASDEDHTALPEDVVLPHSLTDDDIRTRLVDSLRAS